MFFKFKDKKIWNRQSLSRVLSQYNHNKLKIFVKKSYPQCQIKNYVHQRPAKF